FRSSPWIGFWKTLKPGFDAFELTRQVPEISVREGKYVVNNIARVAMAVKAEEHRRDIVQ
ncbi:MAG: 2-dehydro-3-deoxyphosphooctonate aldolase, partial [Desulfobulbaceae bacterium]|nr:2-dehydro-3-deoxyphosphooctonate aldolase [Desulfobulbaceae bacterium]